ncbi:MAG TPA: dipeptidase [Terriglobales bacterium]|nr:dipeptidase [Terriglobales bacterium]
MAQKPVAPRPVAADPRAVHNSALVIDTHADTPQRFLDEGFDIGTITSTADGQFDLDKARAGNLGAEFFSVWVETDGYKDRRVHRTLAQIDSVYQQAARHPERMMMAYSTDDILAARRQGKLAALMGIEGGHMIENDLRLLRMYYKLGARYMTLTHSRTHDWADSSGDVDDPNVKHHRGLTAFGVEVVREMNRLGMLVDISHASDRTFYKTLVVSRAPIIASHSSARALTNHVRNMSDDMLRAIARNRGVVMVNFFSAFIDEKWRQAYAAQKPEREKAKAPLKEKYKDKDVPYVEEWKIEKQWAAKIPRPPLKSLIDHIDHVAKVAGIDHVGLGSDFDGVPALPEGIDSVADLPKITEELLKRGYTPAQVHKILGGNFMRVFREAEGVARELQREKPLGPGPLYAPEE